MVTSFDCLTFLQHSKTQKKSRNRIVALIIYRNISGKSDGDGVFPFVKIRVVLEHSQISTVISTLYTTEEVLPSRLGGNAELVVVFSKDDRVTLILMILNASMLPIFSANKISVFRRSLQSAHLRRNLRLQ